MSILLFEDHGVSQLAPITTARTAFSITVGSFRLIDLVATLQQPILLATRPYLQQLSQLDHSDAKLLSEADHQQSAPQLLLNARLQPSVTTLESIKQLASIAAKQPNVPGVVLAGDDVAAVINPTVSMAELITLCAGNSSALLHMARVLPSIDAELTLMSLPHDVVAANMECIAESLTFRIARGGYEQRQDGVFVADNVSMGDYVITDTSKGPIVIESGASIGPYTLIRGPVYIGQDARILEHAAIKDEVSIGHTTKVGGRLFTWVMYFKETLLPFASGGALRAMASASTRFSTPVATRLFQRLYCATTAGSSLLTPCPLWAEMGSSGISRTWASLRSSW